MLRFVHLYSSSNVSLENLVLDEFVITKLIFFFILITCLFDIVLILLGEILSWSLMGVNGLIVSIFICNRQFTFHLTAT